MVPSFIRTLIPLIVGVALGQAARIGLDLPSDATTQIVTATITFGYFAVVRLIETRSPSVGRWLLAAGLTGQSPVYVPAAAAKRLNSPTQ